MTEEINNLNTDLKELFVENKLEELLETLEQTADNTVIEITIYNYEIIKKYFDTGNFAVLIQHIKFTAFTCFLCEYAAKRQLISNEDFENQTLIFNEIYNKMHQSS
ncbi:hypothetical protein [Anaerocolumna sp. MB42-C2]|uniref:hypothetical protein n=1 Tax=Anaerocolumna sp. MB42-C2 TaxID=3070997 RepID=UPI0027E0D774|nr:hypothetical protein [Anaerocolumna sp. MB42-C2]WMJ89516.1 hypothetical protein RBU59_08325 [Anaerocolumna sp. MB42-C2]